MRQFYPLVVGILCCGGLARAAEEKVPSPLRLMPAEVDAVVQIPQPTKLVEAILRLDVLAQLGKMGIVQEQLDATQARRGRQLLAHFEKVLGMKWPAAIDRLAGGGAAVGLKFGNDAPLVLVVQGSDEKLLEKFLATVVEVLEGELARQESKEKVEKGSYHGIPGFKIGNLLVTRIGATLVASNKKEALARALHLHLGKETKSLAGHPALDEANKILPASPLISAWLNMEPIQKSPAGKELYKSPRDNFALTVLFGSYLDLAGRTPWFAAGLAEEKDGFLFTVRAPQGSEGMGADRALHVGSAAEGGVRELLEPKGVLYSSSFYFDFARIWTDRDKLFPKAQADGLMNFEKNSGPVLAGIKLSTLLESVGARHRIVVTTPGSRPYQREPAVRLPAFAFVAELRQGEKFGRSMDTILRTVALLTTNTFKMELVEEKHAGVDIVGYRFDEKADVKEDVNDVRFNFTPCFARVKDQFVFCSTTGLCKELIDLIGEEKGKGASTRARDRVYAQGFAELLRSVEDQLMTQTILDQAVPPAQAKKQVDEIIALVRGLGALTSEVRFEPKRFRYDVRVQLNRIGTTKDTKNTKEEEAGKEQRRR